MPLTEWERGPFWEAASLAADEKEQKEARAAESAPPAANPPRAYRRTCWRWVAALALALAVAAGLGVARRVLSPRSLAALIEEGLAPEINGTVAIGHAEIRSLTDARVSGIRLSRANVPEPDIEAGRVRVDLDPWAFLIGRAEVRSATVSDGVVRWQWMGPDDTNLLRLFSPKRPARPAKVKSEPPERLLAGGVLCDRMTLVWTHPEIFGEKEPRRFSGINGWWRRGASTADWFEFGGVFTRLPYRGLTFAGWADLNRPEQVRLEFRGNGIPIAQEIIDALPAHVREVMAYLSLQGWVSVAMTVDDTSGRPTDFNLDLSFSGCEVGPAEKDIRAERVRAELNVAEGALDVRVLSAGLCGGEMSGSLSLRQMSDGKRWMRAYGEARGVEMAEVMKRMTPDLPPRKGTMTVTFRLLGQPGALKKAVARGTVTLVDAALLKLPLFSSVLAALNLSVSPSEMVRSGTLKYRLDFERKRIWMEQMTLRSRNVEISGKGWVGFDGDLDMVVVGAMPRDEAGKSALGIFKDVYNYIVGGVQRLVSPPMRLTGTLTDTKVKWLAPAIISQPFGDLYDLLPDDPDQDDPDGKE